ncbi:hypothetical protein EB796_010722 [Bugula neritina]|uniref:Uncharacterized protein n=1 Tax=Bugula neritina TaxID=10212 RepID=A0A7J7JZ31_BUGNE|nr:hypothetical protein EB796_010722 [Bugula neritina]
MQEVIIFFKNRIIIDQLKHQKRVTPSSHKLCKYYKKYRNCRSEKPTTLPPVMNTTSANMTFQTANNSTPSSENGDGLYTSNYIVNIKKCDPYFTLNTIA